MDSSRLQALGMTLISSDRKPVHGVKVNLAVIGSAMAILGSASRDIVDVLNFP